ncbi:MAG: LytTR family DNA-binding domain-containing protein [Acidobacteriota bacterium]
MLRALIVDDEPAGRDRLRDLLQKHRDIEVTAEAEDVPQALTALRETSPDVVFLDIQMPGADGFHLIDEVGVRSMPAVVFVTAYEEHALRAFDVDAVDYLLKPFDEDRFQAALSRVREDLLSRRQRKQDERRRPMDRLPLRSAGRVSFLKVHDIVWVDAAHNYVRIHTSDGQSHVVREAISDLEGKLDSEQFLRIHRSTIVNAEHVRELELSTYGNYIAILTNGQRLTVSRSFRDRLPTLLGN